MYFASDRPGGFGLQDIWRSFRADVHNDFGWQAPTNLGAALNSAADDNASTYFDNGGHPQLIFGSGRLGGAARDLFLSNMQPDGTWGPATLIPELSSPSDRESADDPPGRAGDLLLLGSPGGAGGRDLWTSTRATTDAAWSTPVNLGATVNSSATDQHPYTLRGRADARLRLHSCRRFRGHRSVDDDACGPAHGDREQPEQAVRPDQPTAHRHDQRVRRRRHLRRRFRHRRVHHDRDARRARPAPTRSPAPRARSARRDTPSRRSSPARSP